MPTPRFFHPETLRPMSRTSLSEAVAHHATRVLRLESGSEIVLFDGTGGEYEAKLLVQGRHVQAETGAHKAVERELQGRIVLLQGMASGSKMELVVEKAVELGVSELYPIAAERSVLRLEGQRMTKRLEQWRALVRAASEQCGRNRLMQIHAPAPLRDIFGRLQGHMLFCDPDGDTSLKESLAGLDGQLCLFVGPEGGWAPAEIGLAQDRGLRGIRFGKRILRTETAGIALVAASTALLGW